MVAVGDRIRVGPNYASLPVGSIMEISDICEWEGCDGVYVREGDTSLHLNGDQFLVLLDKQDLLAEGDRVRWDGRGNNAVDEKWSGQVGTVRARYGDWLNSDYRGSSANEFGARAVKVTFDGATSGEYIPWVYESTLTKIEEPLVLVEGQQYRYTGVRGQPEGSDWDMIFPERVGSTVTYRGVRRDEGGPERCTVDFGNDTDYWVWITDLAPLEEEKSVSSAGFSSAEDVIKKVQDVIGAVAQREGQSRGWCGELDTVLRRISDELGFEVKRKSQKLKVTLLIDSDDDSLSGVRNRLIALTATPANFRQVRANNELLIERTSSDTLSHF